MRIEADNLQLAITQAAEKLNCSVTDLDIKVIQRSRAGILGFFKKNAIIDVNIDDEVLAKARIENFQNSSKNALNKKNFKTQKRNSHITQDTILEIKNGLKSLFECGYFEIDEIEVKKGSDNYVYIRLNGKDAAILIGRDGHVYKAISYLIYSWVNIKFRLNVELEIGDFVKNQEKKVAKYLEGVIEKVKQNGRAYTKPFDSILLKIALEQLRKEFPEKYVGVKNGKDGKFIVINDFKK